ncbi:unnamed protein product, partial [Owenia fusiformis]
SEGLTPQGITPQIPTPRGLTPQGPAPQGLTPQSITSQVPTPQSLALQGLTPQNLCSPTLQGPTTPRISLQGLTPQGPIPQGLTQQAPSLQSLPQQAPSLQNLTQQVPTPQGLTSHGTVPQSLNQQVPTPQGLTPQGPIQQSLTQQVPLPQGLTPHVLDLSMTGLTQRSLSQKDLVTQELTERLAAAERTHISDLAERVQLLEHYDPQESPVIHSTGIVLPRFRSGKVDCKTFKPKHFDLQSLQIGTYRMDYDPCDKNRIAKLKVIFSKRRIHYDFQMNSSKDALQTHTRNMANIEVDFESIVGFTIFGREIVIEVNQPPYMRIGQRMKDGFDSERRSVNQLLGVDLTKGQIETVPYHRLTLKSDVGILLRRSLELFDLRFCLMLRLPIFEDEKKILKPVNKPTFAFNIPAEYGMQNTSVADMPKHLLSYGDTPINLPRKDVPTCKCIMGCDLNCQCTQDQNLCSIACGCHQQCANPLNILQSEGIVVSKATLDSCLMGNIYKTPRILQKLWSSLKFPCCNKVSILKFCIPGIITCVKCRVQYVYSWCKGELLTYQGQPIHCAACGRCKRNDGSDSDNQCQKCQSIKHVEDVTSPTIPTPPPLVLGDILNPLS